ncbi:hypothetical protein NDN08_004533 [Rhodosorus marinus]|uniref:Right handed beta helix domain-containing protein n=1 Tax=Rhodosorus marinus TaxID=101924 RepID=A0AAV8ULJ0_9RHOD|nr:hypothetical protein NDN08_004533 [Rhodosorus marinus]
MVSATTFGMCRVTFLLAVVGLLMATGCLGARLVNLECDKSLKQQVEKAKANSKLVADPKCRWETSEEININRPMTINGINVTLKKGVGKTAIFAIRAENVVMQDFVLTGNNGTVDWLDRESLLLAHAGKFIIQRGVFKKASKNGVTVRPDRKNPVNIVGGILRDLVGKKNRRDLASITTTVVDDKLYTSSGIVAEHLEAFDQPERGTIEVTDGAWGITIRDIYAKNCLYAVDIQDHDQHKNGVVKDVQISDVLAEDSTYAVRSETFMNGHSDITIKKVQAKNCMNAVLMDRIKRLKIRDVHIVNGRNESTQVDIANSRYVTLRDLKFSSGVGRSSAVMLRESTNVNMKNIVLAKDTDFKFGITVNSTQTMEKAFRTLTFKNNDLKAATKKEVRYLKWHKPGEEPKSR